MDNTPFDTNNPYKKKVNPMSTLPLDPPVSHQEEEANDRYKPQPPRPEDYDELVGRRSAAPGRTVIASYMTDDSNPETQTPGAAEAMNQATVPPTQGETPMPGMRQAPRRTVNYIANSDERVYETPESYRTPEPAQPAPQPQAPRPTYNLAVPPQRNPAIPPQAQQPQPQQAQPQPTEPTLPRQDAPLPPPPMRRNNSIKPRPTVQADIPVADRSGRFAGPGTVRQQPTVCDGASSPFGGGNGGYADNGNYGAPAKSNRMMIYIIAAVALLLIAGGCVWFFTRDKEQTAEDTPVMPVEMPEATAPTAPADAPAAPAAPAATDASNDNTETTLFNHPLTYTGNVSPGGVASLNVILFQNGRIEGTLDYNNGESMDVYGSYTWTDEGQVMNFKLTISSKTDKLYSESWSGHTSRIKDNLAHTLTFKRINTSNGESKTASFALR